MSEIRRLELSVEIDGIDAHAWRVLAWESTEALSSGAVCRVLLEVREAPSIEELVGKRAHTKISQGDAGTERLFHGVVVDASVDAHTDAWFEVALEIVPQIELLKLGRNCRIFQEKKIPDIVTSVLEDAGITGDALEWKTSATYEPRAYITQYNESDYDFVTRLLHSEGIAFTVRNDEDRERIVCFDDNNQLEQVVDHPTLPFRDRTQLRANVILEIKEARVAASDEVTLRDYDFKHAGADLTVRETAPSSTGREVYVHPGDFVDTSRGQRLAKRTLERLRVETHVFRGRSDCMHLEPGRRFTFEGHPRAELHLDLFVLCVSHSARTEGTDARSGATYTNTFTAIPVPVPYRPRECADRPVQGGIEAAFVSGPGGEELHGSEHGQVKVRYPWDRSGITDDKSSTWLRVGQLALGGSMVIPRVGFEVMVDHELGDHDRPFVVGHTYNGEAAVPYPLPAGATRSSLQTATTAGGAGANELRFDDTAGSEEMFINASHDYVTSIENNVSTEVKVNQKTKTGGNATTKIGANLTTNVVGNRTMTVSGAQKLNIGGDYGDGITGALKVTVGSRNAKIGGDLMETVQGTLSRKVGGLQCITGVAGYERKVAGSSTQKVGGVWLESCGGSRAVNSKVFLETVGALKFVKAKTMSVSCQAALVMNEASESVNCGGNRTDKGGGAAAVNAGGGLSVKAANINITGESEVMLRVGGSSIQVKSGKITIKSPSIDLGDVKDILSTASHKTNT